MLVRKMEESFIANTEILNKEGIYRHKIRVAQIIVVLKKTQVISEELLDLWANNLSKIM